MNTKKIKLIKDKRLDNNNSGDSTSTCNEMFAILSCRIDLAIIVDAIPVTLRKSLKNPPNVLPEYTTMINVEGGSLTLEDITNVSYSVVSTPAPTPVPGAIWFLGSGLVGLVGLKRKRLPG